MIVVDASVVVDDLLGGPSPAGDALAAVLTRHEPVSAPHLLDVEVGQVLRRFVLRDHLAAGIAEKLLGELTALPISRYEHADRSRLRVAPERDHVRRGLPRAR